MKSSGLSFDDALTKYVGEFGPSQKKVFLAASIFWLPNALYILLMVFSSKDPINAHLWRCVSTTDVECARVYALDQPAADFCMLPRDSWAWTQPKHSIISDYNLQCGKAWLAQLANSAFFLGYLFGSGTFGTLADHHGRRRTLLLASGCATLFTLLSGFSSSFWVYLASRLLTGIGAAGQALVTYLLATESVGPTWRGIVGVGTQMFFIGGEFLLVLVAYVLQQWHGMCFCISILGAATTGLLLLIPESPRWLLAKGRRAEAEAIMSKIAEGNGTRMPLEPLTDAHPAPDPAVVAAAVAVAAESGALISGVPNSSSGGVSGAAGASASGTPAAAGVPAAAPPVAAEAPLTLWALLKYRNIARRFFILAYVWCTLCLTYYGISLALNGLKGSLYVTFMISAAAEIPSNMLAAWMIERLGRHNSLSAGMLLAGVACLICSFCPPGPLQALFAAVGKFGCAGAFTIASIFTSELFPTLVRSAVLGAENEAARVGGISAPFIVLLGTQLHNPSLPFIVFGVTSVIAGFLILTLPETLGAPMPDTMKDMDAIQSIFTTGAYKQGWRVASNALFSTHAYGSVLARVSESASENHHHHGGSITGHTSQQAMSPMSGSPEKLPAPSGQSVTSAAPQGSTAPRVSLTGAEQAGSKEHERASLLGAQSRS